MSDTRTYIVPDGQENSTNQMLPWMAMMNGGMGGFGNGIWNNPFMYLVWMWMMRWMNRGEFGDGNNCQNLQSAEIQSQLAGLREQMNTNQNTQLLMDAIKGNAQKLTGYDGADITVSQIPGTGIYLCWFEHSTNTLQLLTGVV